MENKLARYKDKVNWDRAGCKGADRELFFMPLKELLAEGFSYRSLRRVCFGCPIWRECLEWASENEGYGFWGGFSEEERKDLYEGKLPRSYVQMNIDLHDCGVELEEAHKIITKNERRIGYSGALNKSMIRGEE